MKQDEIESIDVVEEPAEKETPFQITSLAIKMTTPKSYEQENETLLATTKFLETAEPLLLTIAGTNDITFMASNNPGDFCFRPVEGVISIGVFKNKSYERNLLGAGHEVEHLGEMLSDPETFIGQFTYGDRRARQVADIIVNRLEANGTDPKIIKILTQIIPSEGVKEPRTILENLILSELRHFYNCVEDVAVNRKVSLRIPMFAPDGSKKDELRRLYEEDLYPDFDLSGDPPHRQFSYALSLKLITPDSPYTFSADIEKELAGSTGNFERLSGLTVLKEVSLLTNPARLGGKNIDYRYKTLRQKIEPIFVRLLIDDIVNTVPKTIEEAEKQAKEEEQKNNQGDQGDQSQQNATPQTGTEQQSKEDKTDSRQEEQDQGQSQTSKPETKQNQQDKDGKQQNDSGQEGHQQKPEEQQDEQEQGNNEQKQDEQGQEGQQQGQEKASKGDEGKNNNETEGNQQGSGKSKKDTSGEESETGENSGEAKDEKQDRDDQQNSSEQGQSGNESPTEETPIHDININPWGTPKGNLYNSPEDRKQAAEAAKIFRQKMNEKKQKETLKSNRTPKERAEQAQTEADERICQTHDISPESAARYRQIEKQIEPYKEALSRVFEEYMKSINDAYRNFYVEGCRSGRFNVETLINKYGPEVAIENVGGMSIIPWDTLEVYDRQEIESRLSMVPSEIYMHLVLDTSGSMEKERIIAIKQITVLFMEALNSFEARVNQNFRLKKPFSVNLEVRTFDSDTEIVKPMQRNPDVGTEASLRFGALDKMIPKGRTHDCLPLGQINESLLPNRLVDIKKRKAMELVFLITDGGSNTPDKTATIVDELNEKKVMTRGIQIGNPDGRERKIFNNIWGAQGIRVNSLEELAPNMVTLFREFLGEFPPEIQFYEEDDYVNEII